MTDTRESRGKLYVVGTPIGNLDDLSARARDVLAKANIIAAEDTRHTRGLLSRIGVESRLIAYHEHNETERVTALLAELEQGRSVALVSDAGTPLISDPGWRLVAAARAAGIAVIPVPGPCAAIAALSVAGVPTDHFVFEGFLPRRDGARAERLDSLRREQRTIVFYEAVHRIAETLAALRSAFGGERRAALARELTKTHEQIATGTLAELEARLDSSIPLLGEFVLVVAGAGATSPDEAEAQRVYELLATELAPDKALKLAVAITGVARNTLYRLTRTKN
ncbi:MAG TPA: 16S rRNA (cytidine(1402)-2'-O)-methyltransferase [Gammaproteobacteria bacterium]|nr:16S rRNA (cytidine(1402)-2'-O)-methyltransferase [Gammaproteobacteria bacterium]